MDRSTLSHYSIVKKLGAGGMGEVYLAQDTKLDRKVAIKFVPPDLTSDEQAQKRLIREARAAAKLDHPNICSIYEVAEEDHRAFIVMQYVEGETLASRIQRKPLELKETLDTAVQLADALAEADSRGIIHRDIKPQNIMFTARGQVKILDFGLAKVITNRGLLETDAETKSLLTGSGVIVGTVPYMSPEQVRGESLDGRSDLFSFGAVLYEMISGRQPFAAKTAAEIISAVLMSEPPPLSSSSAGVPASLERIVLKCLEKDRERRYQSAAEIVADLESVRRQCETGEVGPSIADAATLRIEAVSRPRMRWPGLPRSRTAVGLIVLVILSAVATAYALFFRRPILAPASGSRTVNSEAYNDYVRGKVMVSSQNRNDNDAAIKLLEQAVTADSKLAAAWAELARAYTIKTFYFAAESERKQLNLEAEVAVEKALTLDSELPEAHAARGLLLWSHAKGFPHEQAIQAYKLALTLKPDFEEAHHQLGTIYFHIGLLDKAWTEIENGLSINPANTLARFRFGVINIYQGKYEEALTVLKGIPREANPSLVDRNIATALFQLGKLDEASAAVETYLKSYPNDEGGAMTSVKAMLLAKGGKTGEAEEAIQRAKEIGKGFGHFHHTAYNIAVTYAILKRPEEAINSLQEAAEDGFPCYPWFENDANLDNLRKDERFIALMNRLRKQWQHYQATL